MADGTLMGGEILSGIAQRRPTVTIATTAHRERRQQEVPATVFPRLHFHIAAEAGSTVMMSHSCTLGHEERVAEGDEEDIDMQWGVLPQKTQPQSVKLHIPQLGLRWAHPAPEPLILWR